MNKSGYGLTDECTENAMGDILETLGAARWTVCADDKGNITAVRWSRELCGLLGFESAPEMLSSHSSAKEIIHPDDFGKVYSELKAAMSDRTWLVKYDTEYRLKTADGKYHWFRSVGKRSHCESGVIFSGILMDIDKRKHRESAVAQNLNVMASLNREYTAIYFVDFDLNSYTSYFNTENSPEPAAEVVGQTGVYTDIISQCIELFVVESEREVIRKLTDIDVLKKRIETEPDISIRYRSVLDHEGREYFEMRIIRSGDSHSHQAVIAYRSIDDIVRRESLIRRDMESDIKKSEYQKVLVLHHALRSSMWTIDFEQGGKNISMDWGERFRLMMEFKPEELPITLEKCFEKFHPDDRAGFIACLSRTMGEPDENFQYIGEARIMTDGEYRWFQIAGKVFRKTAALYSFVGVLTDIDEEKRLKEALSEKVSQLENTKAELESALAEANLSNEIISAIGKCFKEIYRADLTENRYEKISSDGNKYSLSVQSGTLDEMSRIGVEMLTAPEYRDSMAEFLDFKTLPGRMRDKETITIDVCGFNGRWYSVCFIAKKRDNDGNVTNVLYAISDITDQKSQELMYKDQLIKTAEEARHANIAKTDFLRRMSHDIRTPINGIRGMVEIANHYPNDVVKLKECRDKVWEASGYLLSLVNSVLDMNKLESGSIAAEEEPFDLYQLMKQTNAVIEMRASEYGVDFSGDISDIRSVHRYLIGSPTYLKQILMNLASNAIKYNREGGSVTVSCEELSGDEDSVVFRFICADTGIGMSPEFQKQAFEPFAQERKDARSTFTGSGLGLSITKKLVEHMNGTIELTSIENSGTVFAVTIPFIIDKNPSAHSESKHEKVSDLRGKRVLIAEDNDINMEIAVFILEQHGLEVTTAVNGKKAAEIFAASDAGHFDAVLMDIMMPVMNGLEAAKLIRSMDRPDAKTIPIFAMTANAFIDDIHETAEAGMNEHLTKPLDENKIMSVLRKYLA